MHCSNGASATPNPHCSSAAAQEPADDPLETDSGSESRDSVSRTAEGSGAGGGGRGGQDTPSAKSEREDEPDSEQDDLAAATGQWVGDQGVTNQLGVVSR